MSLIRVFKMPEQYVREYCFGSGHPHTFMMVDWFGDDLQMMTTEGGRRSLESFIKKKNYYQPDRAYLVVSEMGCFTINYVTHPDK